MNIVIVDKSTHAQTRVVTNRGKHWDAPIHFVPIVLDEIKQLALEYPIAIRKHPEIGYSELGVLLGFEEEENLYLRTNGWRSRYIPLNIQRQPFFISLDTHNNRSIITIDNCSPRVSHNDGESLFNHDGEPSNFLLKIGRQLTRLLNGELETKAYLAQCEALNLLCPIENTLPKRVTEQLKLDHLYTINDEILTTLEATNVTELHLKHTLRTMYEVQLSAGHMRKLYDWKILQIRKAQQTC